MIGAVLEQGGPVAGQPFGILRVEIGAELFDDGAMLPFGKGAQIVERGGRLADLADAFPRLLAGQPGQFAIADFVVQIVEQVAPEHRHQPVLAHVRGEDQIGEQAFRAGPAPQIALVAGEPEIAVAARKRHVEPGLAGKDLGDPRLGERSEHRKVAQRAAGRFGEDGGKRLFESVGFRVLVIDLAPVEGDVAFAGRAFVAQNDGIVANSSAARAATMEFIAVEGTWPL